MNEELHHPSADEIELATVLAALADPARLALLRGLNEVGEAACGSLTTQCGLDLSKSTVSHHMKVLRESGVTHTRAQGTHRYVSLRRSELDSAFPQLLDAVLGAAAPVVRPRPPRAD